MTGSPTELLLMLISGMLFWILLELSKIHRDMPKKDNDEKLDEVNRHLNVISCHLINLAKFNGYKLPPYTD